MGQSSGSPPLNWQKAARAPLWSLVVVLAAYAAAGVWVQLIASPRHWFRPISQATHGLVPGTLQAGVLFLIVIVGGVIVAGAHLKPHDLGLRAVAVGPAVCFTLLLWACINLFDVSWLWIGHQPLALHPDWTKPGVLRTSGTFIAQILGNALVEEILFRGFLTVQVILLLRRLGGFPSILLAIVVVQLAFAAPHVPLLMREKLPLTSLWFIFVTGVALAVIYLVTDNLLMAVGAHALSNSIMLVCTDPGGFIDAHSGLLYCGLAVLFAAVLAHRRPGGVRGFLRRLRYFDRSVKSDNM